MYEVTMVFNGIWRQFLQIAPYWACGLAAGSLVSVFFSIKIAAKMERLSAGRFRLLPLFFASLLGIVSPLCMYGTVPIIAAFWKKGVSQHLLAAFMVSSILLNPNIMLMTFSLGAGIAAARIALSLLSGILAGALVYFTMRDKQLFSFERFADKENCPAKPDSPSAAGKETDGTAPKKKFFPDLFKAIRITAPYLLFGITLSALFDRYIPPEWVSAMFGARRGLGVLFAATLSIPLYACGGGTIPLISAWMNAGMGSGDAMAFMLAGPAVKINNLSAVKMIFGAKNFLLYIAYCLLFAIAAGLAIEVIV